jgi:hypothetical protein
MSIAAGEVVDVRSGRGECGTVYAGRSAALRCFWLPTGRMPSPCAGITFNRILTSTLSMAAKYVRTRNDADIYFKDDAGNLTVATGIAKIPFTPRDFFSAGMAWVTPQRIYFSAQAVYRSQRFVDRDNTEANALRADWNG